MSIKEDKNNNMDKIIIICVNSIECIFISRSCVIIYILTTATLEFQEQSYIIVQWKCEN